MWKMAKNVVSCRVLKFKSTYSLLKTIKKKMCFDSLVKRCIFLYKKNHIRRAISLQIYRQGLLRWKYFLSVKETIASRKCLFSDIIQLYAITQLCFLLFIRLSFAQCPIHFSSDRSNRRYFCGSFRHAIGRRGSIQRSCGRILVSLSRFSLDNHQLRLSGVSIKARI